MWFLLLLIGILSAGSSDRWNGFLQAIHEELVNMEPIDDWLMPARDRTVQRADKELFGKAQNINHNLDLDYLDLAVEQTWAKECYVPLRRELEQSRAAPEITNRVGEFGKDVARNVILMLMFHPRGCFREPFGLPHSRPYLWPYWRHGRRQYPFQPRHAKKQNHVVKEGLVPMIQKKEDAIPDQESATNVSNMSTSLDVMTIGPNIIQKDAIENDVETLGSSTITDDAKESEAQRNIRWRKSKRKRPAQGDYAYDYPSFNTHVSNTLPKAKAKLL